MPQTPARHHAEWLSLLEISGPFLSMPVLLTAFPQGLDDFPPEEARSLRADYEYWKENLGDAATHTAWVRLVLESMLGYTSAVLLAGQAIPGGLKAEFPEHEETIRPDLLLAEPGNHKPRLLIQVYPPGQGLDKGLQGSRWQASIGTRMMELLHASEIRLGLVTNGEDWLLVDAPRGETSGFITWYAGLWFDEPVTLRALRSLLGVKRFFGVPDEETLESLLAKSAQDQQEITDQLGLQVRHAVEILIQSLDRADQDNGRKLLGAQGAQGAQEADVPPALLYEAALTVMMRLVFMLSAEERKLLPIDDERYAAYYAVSTLREQLQSDADQNGEDVLERRYDAWCRLLAVFRAVYAGTHHQDLHVPAYGGSLFDPERYPFLEGRSLLSAPVRSGAGGEVPLPVNNRTVLHLLDALQMLQISVPGGAAEKRRLSFRALDVEQIGHVYEGLLDHQATRAAAPVLGLKGSKNQEPEVALADLEKAAAKGEAALLDWLHEQTGRSLSALKNALALDLFKVADQAQQAATLRSACGGEELYRRVLPFAGLLRQDDLGFPVVILPGSVYVTAGTTRRATGTHYTPRSLTEPIVQHTLEPLVYQGPAEGWPKAEWQLRQPGELLALKVCDMAMGSAGFLVQVVRYLSEQLVEAWARYGPGDGAQGDVELVVFGQAAATMTPEDRLIYARRLVAERCVYGVDKNPLAVEIAKLSLWLVTMAKDRPFTFLNHALKCGDSLVGTSTEDFLRWANRKKSAAISLDQAVLRESLEESRRLRRQLESFTVRDLHDAEVKTNLHHQAEVAMAHIKRGADLMAGTKLLGLKEQEVEDAQLGMLDLYLAGELDTEIDVRKHPNAARALSAAMREYTFHWEFEFPEVFEKTGFDVFVGNPPFLGGTKISTYYGDNYADYLKISYESFTGNADLCALFFVRAYQKISQRGYYSLIATKTISQGNTLETGLGYLKKQKAIIFTAETSRNWPGQAAVVVSIVSLTKAKFSGEKILNNRVVKTISSSLSETEEVFEPMPLSSNNGLSFNGSKLDGIGFVLENEVASKLFQANPNNRDVIFRYLGGQDLNTRPDQSPGRWVINFFEWDIDKAKSYEDCFSIVQEKVYPYRQTHSERRTRENWWQFTRVRNELYQAISPLKNVIAISQATKYIQPSLVGNDAVFDQALVLIASESLSLFAVINSSLHSSWALEYQTSLGTTPYYIPTKAFLPYPFPNLEVELENLGKSYHEHRRQVMLTNQDGLTATYNRFHSSEERNPDITHMRELHVQIDNAVAAAYGWEDLALGHGFHQAAQGTRYTISEAARREVLARLLKLNHERYEEEQRQAGLQEKPKKAAKDKPAPAARPVRAASAAPAQFSLIPDLVPDPEPLSQPALLPAPSVVASAPAGSIGSWDQAICLACGKHLVGYMLEEHTKTVHGGVEVGYRKV